MPTRSDTRERSTAEPEPGLAEHPASTLCGVLVEYDRRPDRRTICPRSPTRDELLTAWITADPSAIYDLAEVRCAQVGRHGDGHAATGAYRTTT